MCAAVQAVPYKAVLVVAMAAAEIVWRRRVTPRHGLFVSKHLGAVESEDGGRLVPRPSCNLL